MRLFGNFIFLQGISFFLLIMLTTLFFYQHLKSKYPKKISDDIETNHKFEEYGEHLKTLGAKIINDLKMEIMKECQKLYDIDSLSNHYKAVLQRNFEFMSERYRTKVGSTIDNEFMLLNMLQRAWKLLYFKQWKIVKIANAKMESIKPLIPIVSNFIRKRNMNERIQEMKYICEKYNVCKPYPAFTDYFADFIQELLSLSDNQLKEPMNHLIKNLVNNTDLVTILQEVKNNESLVTAVANLYNSTSIKDILFDITTVIHNRHKFHHAQNLNEQNHVQALRSLLNIINEAFGDVNIVGDFEDTIMAIKDWDDGEMSKSVIERFVVKIFKTIKKFHTSVFNDLVDTIVTGELGDLPHFFKGYNGVFVKIKF